MNRKELEEKLRRAFSVDKLLPAVGLKRLTASIGKMVVLPDGRPLKEILEERRAYDTPTNEDLNLWESVMFEWLPLLDFETRSILQKRCSGMGWKRIANEAHTSVRTVQRRFEAGLNLILNFLETVRS